MTFTLTLKMLAWIPAALVTAVALAWAIWPRVDERPYGTMFSGMGQAIGLAVRLPAAAALALAAWLAWALLA